MRGAPVLRGDQRIESRPACGHARDAVEALHRGRNRILDALPLRRRAGQFSLQVMRSPRHLRMPLLQVGELIAQPFQLRMRIPENHLVLQRADRQLVRVVSPHREGAFLRIESKR